ncbi:unnamed protein product [Diamesa hyperborea]
MGKVQKTIGIPQSVDTLIQTQKSSNFKQDVQKPSIYCIKSLINICIYTTCILSLSISLYLNYRHNQLESSVKNLLFLDNKVFKIEHDLDELIRKTNSLYPTINNNIDELVKRDLSIERGELPKLDETTPTNNDNDVIEKKLSLHVFTDLHRLKRDVSNLKMARRQRQTAIQQQSPNECLCTTGL